tara:strand:- start:28 stop:453 length:426 start_codon:yes stop_codon:yes gene_type:complete
MPGLGRNGTDEEFTHELFSEITYSKDNRDYTIIHRLVIARLGNKKLYFLRACDPTNPVKQFQLEASSENEAKLTATNSLDVLTKIWPHLTMTGTPNEFQNYIINSILKEVCDTRINKKNDVQFTCVGNSFKMIFDGVEFTK